MHTVVLNKTTRDGLGNNEFLAHGELAVEQWSPAEGIQIANAGSTHSDCALRGPPRIIQARSRLPPKLAY